MLPVCAWRILSKTLGIPCPCRPTQPCLQLSCLLQTTDSAARTSFPKVFFPFLIHVPPRTFLLQFLSICWVNALQFLAHATARSLWPLLWGSSRTLQSRVLISQWLFSFMAPPRETTLQDLSSVQRYLSILLLNAWEEFSPPSPPCNRGLLLFLYLHM